MKKITERILFIAHGKKNKARKLQSQLLKLKFPDFNVLFTTKRGEAVEMAYNNCQLYSHIIAIGGDGTLHEVINGIMNNVGDGNVPIISLIPSGTANDFSRTIKFPATIPALYNAIKANQQVRCDLVKLQYSSPVGIEQRAWFVNIADAGIGSAVVEEISKQQNYLQPHIAFFRAILLAFRRYRNIPVRCKADDWEWEGHIKILAAANGKYFGSGLAIAPHAKTDDGMLAVTIAADISTYDYIINLPNLLMGKKINHPQVFYKEARSLKLTSSQRCPIEADGEVIGFTPAEFTVLENRLRFLISVS